LPYVLNGGACALADILDRRARTGADVFDCRIEPFSYEVSGTRADVLDR